MGPTTTDLIDTCFNCGLSLPLRHPRPGEVGSDWKCSYCNARIYAVLVDKSPPDVIDNVHPDGDVHPRMTLGDRILATMHKRGGQAGRVFDERDSERKTAGFTVTIRTDDWEIRVRTIDLSSGGFGFVCDRPIGAGTLIAAQFHSLPGAATTSGVVRSCVSAANDQYRIGVQFAPYAEDPAGTADS